MAKENGRPSSLQNVPHVDGVVVIAGEKQAAWRWEEASEGKKLGEVGNLDSKEAEGKGFPQITKIS